MERAAGPRYMTPVAASINQLLETVLWSADGTGNFRGLRFLAGLTTPLSPPVVHNFHVLAKAVLTSDPEHPVWEAAKHANAMLKMRRLAEKRKLTWSEAMALKGAGFELYERSLPVRIPEMTKAATAGAQAYPFWAAPLGLTGPLLPTASARRVLRRCLLLPPPLPVAGPHPGHSREYRLHGEGRRRGEAAARRPTAHHLSVWCVAAVLAARGHCCGRVADTDARSVRQLGGHLWRPAALAH